MSRLFLDTNVLLDLVVANRPCHKDAVALFEAAFSHGWELAALISSLKDVYFVYERHHGTEAQARQAVMLLREMLCTVELTNRVFDTAARSDEPDLEDGMVRTAAQACGAVAIVSRDEEGFLLSPIPKLSPFAARQLVLTDTGDGEQDDGAS